MTNPLFKSSVACEMAPGSEVLVIIVLFLFIANFLCNNLLNRKDFIQNLVSPSVATGLVATFEKSSHRLICGTGLNLHEISSLMVAKI